MTAIYKRELKSYFQSMTGYVLIAPVKLFDIVMGKYLAMVTVFAIPCLIFCIFPIIIKSFGTAYLKVDYLSILMFFLLGCVYLAIGMFLSSLTESQIIAAVTTFGVLLLIYLWGGLIDFLPTSATSGMIGIVVFGKLDDRRNYRSDRSCCGCDRKLCKIFII